MATLRMNISQANADFQAIKNKIIERGVEVVDGTPTSNYSAKVDEVYEAGRKSEYDEFWDALQNNGSRTDYYYGFCGYSWTAKTFKPKYDLKGTRFMNTFFVTNLFSGSLIEILDKCGVVIDTSKATLIQNMFGYSGVSDVPHIDFSGLTNYGVGDMFNQCTNLKKIDKLTLKEGVYFGSGAFNNCSSLEEIEFAGVLSTNNLNLQWSPKLTHDSLVSLINCLKDYSENTSGTTYTIKIGNTNLAKLTEAEIQIAYNKGWDIV